MPFYMVLIFFITFRFCFKNTHFVFVNCRISFCRLYIFVPTPFISKKSPLFSHNRKKRPFLEVNNFALEG